jgi:hypothetical protein
VDFLDIDTALGRAWLAAASVEKNVMTDGMEGDALLRSEVSRLARSVKILCELLEQHQNDHR